MPKDIDKTIADFVAERNHDKLLFTAGPSSLLPENLTGLRPCFGRGDDDYTQIENQVLNHLKSLTGHKAIARMQGSASLALEIMAVNFLFGRVLVISTGYYSKRLKLLAESAQRHTSAINFLATADWKNIETISGHFDWVLACYTETSRGLRLPITTLHDLTRRVGARLMLDATASIGLEERHELADVIAYSSCKGLFGLTGAAFIAFNEGASVEPDSFYLSLSNHLEKKMTGPYHAISSLLNVLPKHEAFKAAVSENKRMFTKRMASYISIPASHQALLCTQVSCNITSQDPRAILYKPRDNEGGSVVCHLGEVHLEHQARGEILDALHVTPV